MKIRIYYEDTDCGNIVYYANYLKFMERSRTEYLRERGIDLAELYLKGILFVVIDVHATYRAPAVYNDLLDVESSVIDFTSTTVTFTTTITNKSGKLLVKGDVRLACINKEGRATKIPEQIREMLISDPIEDNKA